MSVFWGAFTMRDPKQHQDNLAELFTMYARGQVKPRVTNHFSFEEAGNAIQYVADRQALEKSW